MNKSQDLIYMYMFTSKHLLFGWTDVHHSLNLLFDYMSIGADIEVSRLAIVCPCAFYNNDPLLQP